MVQWSLGIQLIFFVLILFSCKISQNLLQLVSIYRFYVFDPINFGEKRYFLIFVQDNGIIPPKKLQNFEHFSKSQEGNLFWSHTFSENKVWTKMFMVGRSDIDVHTHGSMQNSKYCDVRDIIPVVGRAFLYILSHSSATPFVKLQSQARSSALS